MLHALQRAAADSRTPVALMVASVVLAGGGLVSASAVGDDGPAEALSATGAPSTTLAPPPGDEPTPAGAGEVEDASSPVPSSATPGASATEPGARASAAPPPPADGQPDSALAVTTPGTYRVRVDQSGEESSNHVAQLIVEDLGDGRQIHRRRGEDASSDTEVAWRDDGVVILSTTAGAGGFEIHCQHDPAILQSPRRLGPGVTWTGEDTCQYEQAGGGTLTIRIEGRVERAEQIQVAGEAVDTWVVHTVLDIHADTAFGVVHQRDEGPSWVDPARGLVARSDHQRRSTRPTRDGASATKSSRVVSEILDLRPA